MIEIVPDAAFIEYEDVRDAEDAVRKLDGGEWIRLLSRTSVGFLRNVRPFIGTRVLPLLGQTNHGTMLGPRTTSLQSMSAAGFCTCMIP